MRKVICFIFISLLLCASAVAKGLKLPTYELTGAGSGNEGHILVKVFVYEKSPSDADLKRCAVHGVVFRGCSGNNSGANQPAMASVDAQADHQTFCEEFFAQDGSCLSYASIVEGSYERIKTQKGYKVAAIVEVNKTALRKHLEKAGLVRSLSSGF